MTNNKDNKPIIATIINSIALTLTSFGVLQITQGIKPLNGYVAILFGVSLEYVKYQGMKKKLW